MPQFKVDLEDLKSMRKKAEKMLKKDLVREHELLYVQLEEAKHYYSILETSFDELLEYKNVLRNRLQNLPEVRYIYKTEHWKSHPTRPKYITTCIM